MASHIFIKLTLCKPSCCLIVLRGLLHNHCSQKGSRGRPNLAICLWWNFNQHTMHLILVRSLWPGFLQRFRHSSVLIGQKNIPDAALSQWPTYPYHGLLSPSEQPAAQPSSDGLYCLEGEAGALPVALMPFCIAFLFWLLRACWGLSETQLFLWALRSLTQQLSLAALSLLLGTNTSATQAVFVLLLGIMPFLACLHIACIQRAACCHGHPNCWALQLPLSWEKTLSCS